MLFPRPNLRSRRIASPPNRLLPPTCHRLEPRCPSVALSRLFRPSPLLVSNHFLALPRAPRPCPSPRPSPAAHLLYWTLVDLHSRGAASASSQVARNPASRRTRSDCVTRRLVVRRLPLPPRPLKAAAALAPCLMTSWPAWERDGGCRCPPFVPVAPIPSAPSALPWPSLRMRTRSRVVTLTLFVLAPFVVCGRRSHSPVSPKV